MQDNDYPCYHDQESDGVDKYYHQYLQCYSTSKDGPKVIGGINARRTEFPHMVNDESPETDQWLCGGSVISERFILTAGHCRAAAGGLEVQLVALGILKRSDPPSLWQVYRVDAFIPHPVYRPPSKYHDIALIRTDRQISFSQAVLPACLPQPDTNSYPPQGAYGTGWGQQKQGRSLTDVLQKVWLGAIPPLSCREHYGPTRSLAAGFDDDTHLCYGDSALARDTCEGDSGGPLQLDSCPHVILGVTSAGHPCGDAGSAGLYTKVQAFVPWIESVVWP